MKREQLEHVLRAASRIVIGSQSILGELTEDKLPPEATASIEVDVAFFDDADDTKADTVDGAIGELSPFHQTFGYYAQGVSTSTAVLPAGWREKDYAFATALVTANLVEPAMLTNRLDTLPADPRVTQRIQNWVATIDRP